MEPVQSNHIAIRVSNLERSVEFFHVVLGSRQLTDPLPLDQSACHRLFGGPEGGSARFVFIGFESLDQPAFELIEFIDPAVPTLQANPWEDNLMHWCFTVSDVDATLARAESLGAQRFGEVARIAGDDGSEVTQVYFHDPDGNMFQLLGAPLEDIVRRLRAISNARETLRGESGSGHPVGAV